MKKNRAMRVAAMLLVLVMMTSCFVGGTFAKYTTKSTGLDKARVAYWGFRSASTRLSIQLFKGSYDNTVHSSNGESLIAPGASGEEELTFFYYVENPDEGLSAPEVDYTFTVDATGTISDDIKNNPNIKWYLDGELATAEGKTTGSWDALLDAIKALSEDGVVKAGNLPTYFDQGATHTVKWEWAFETKDADDKPDATQDAFDTAMGNKGTLDEVSIEITITATQVD